MKQERKQAMNEQQVHRAITAILEHFKFDHLPPQLASISKPFCDLAHALALGDNCEKSGNVTLGPPLEGPELTVALRKLLEAKDAAVRAAVVMHNQKEQAAQKGTIAESQARVESAIANAEARASAGGALDGGDNSPPRAA